jgi:excisionase family DNA binding protein
MTQPANVVQLRAREEPDEIMTRGELAGYLKVSTRTVDRLVKEGLPSELWGPRLRRFRVAAVNRWLARRAA